MNRKKLYKIIFFGTPLFAAETLEKLAHSFRVLACVTQPDKPYGRKKEQFSPPVKIQAEKLGILVFQPKKISDIHQKLKDEKPDLGILFAYHKILPQDILNIFPFGIINIHPSLLPKYRGPSPVQTALLNGDTVTGVTLIKIDEKLDHGPILAQKEFPISDTLKTPELMRALAKLGTELLLETIPKYLNLGIAPIPQDEKKATFSKIITREDGLIDCAKSCSENFNRARAYFGWPGVYIIFQNKRLKILEMKILENFEKKSLKKFFITPLGNLGIACSDGALEAIKVQLEGKKPMTAKEFLRGSRYHFSA